MFWRMIKIAESLLFSDKTRNKKIADSGKTIRYFWSRRRDLNPRPYGPEPYALPAALRLDFFKFLSIFVSGQTCGQATYFERFVEKCTARIVSVVKGFRGSKKSTKECPCGCPEPYALPAALRFNLQYFLVIFVTSLYIIANNIAKVKSFS